MATPTLQPWAKATGETCISARRVVATALGATTAIATITTADGKRVSPTPMIGERIEQ